MIEWISHLDEHPVTRPSAFRNVYESDPILVWINDGKLKCAALGRFYLYSDRSWDFKADGYNGDWVITHWAELNPPK